MNIRERLLSHASVGVMAAFAPKPEAGAADTSKVGQAERVDGAGGADDGADDVLGLSAEEQAQFDAMQAGKEPAAKDDIEAGTAGDAGDAGQGEGGDDDGDDDGDGGEPGPGEAAAAGDGAAGAGDGKGEPTRIGYGKHKRMLEKERQRAEELQRRLDGLSGDLSKEREARVRLDERTKQLLEAIQQRPAAQQPAAPKEPEDPEPNLEEDPIGHAQWETRQLRKRLDALEGTTRQRAEQSDAEREQEQLASAYSEDIQAKAGEDASFGEAFVHLRETRYRELGFIFAGIDIMDKEAVEARLTPEEQGKLSQYIKAVFHNEQMEVARQAVRTRRRPADIVLNLARARGWAPKAPAPAPAGGGAAAEPGAAPAAPRAAAPAGSVKDQLAAIREGAAASRSLSNGGGSPGGEMTPERLAAMSDEEFEEFYSGTTKNRFDRIMGKPAVQ